MSVSSTISKDLTVQFLRTHDLPGRARVLAQHIAESMQDGAVALYMVEAPLSSWKVVAVAGEIHLPTGQLPLETGRLSNLARTPEGLVLSDGELCREDYAHLKLGREPRCWAALPILSDRQLVGAVEMVSFDGAIKPTNLVLLRGLLEDVGPALAHPLRYEQERANYLTAISRLHELYDSQKIFNSTMEMELLFDLVPSKFREILQVRAVNLWLVKDEKQLLLVSRAGDDRSLPMSTPQQAREGLVSQVSDSGEPGIINDPEDPYLKQRNAALADGKISCLMASPLVAHGDQIGVVEAVDKLDGSAFNEDDLLLLTSLSETAAQALNNASLLHAERKVQILNTLVKVSTELASTLNLDRLLQSLVHLPGAVIPYERASVAIEQRGQLQLKAVSGMTQIRSEDVGVKQLTGMLEWASTARDMILVTQHGEVINDSRADTRLRFKRYFEETSMRGFCALPLADGEGRLGVLCFESSDPDFISPSHLEMVRVLGAQATVALRNASLYHEVPFIGVLEPLLQKKQKFLALEKRRRAIWSVAGAAAVIFLAGFPMPMRVEGDATLVAAHTAQVQPMIEGTIRAVHVREGQHVRAGDVLADLEDWDSRAALAAAQAKSAIAESEADRALSVNDSSAAGMQRAQVDFWNAEIERDRQRLQKTQLRAPFDGWVTTPHIEDLAGRHLAPGDNFAEVVDDSMVKVDIGLDDPDVLLVQPGSLALVKLDSLPTRTFRGEVAIVSPKSDIDGDRRSFFARVALPNPDGIMRPGMQGRAKISVGWHPVGYILFRRLILWVYSKLWSWISL